MPACNFLNMETIHLQQTLPQVFADRNSITSDIWHKNIIFRKGEMYLIEAASGTGKSSLCSYIYGYRSDYQGIINFDETNIKAYTVEQWVNLRKHSLSMLFQDLRIFSELTALENIQLKSNLTGYKKKKEMLGKINLVMIVVMSVLGIVYLGITVFKSIETLPAYYFLMPLFGAATLMQIVRNGIAVGITKNEK